ncbi:hypothetical protein CTAYLR_006147 [Chrysophaeum taylorii]|uniref:Uncharacterized protein n=1 Tax=Chrysophaeum taylorii TaxID=2483200 RepID=A0AAD7UNC9_9STRA|nr:hypothetical protein CTAYLR_006147 [Chrysophaeum taylorii]
MRRRAIIVLFSACTGFVYHGTLPRRVVMSAGQDSLPLSYRSDNGTRDAEFQLAPRNATSTALLPFEEDNEYYRLVAALSPKEIIGRFAKTAPERVQEAVRQTIMGLLGNAGGFAMETTTATTSERLANLMFQLQMTGYMFKNAEYRVSLSESLESIPALAPSDMALNGEDDDELPQVRGQVKVKVGAEEVTVDADAYMAELRNEVTELRRELALVETEKTATARRDLLAYIRSMPQEQMGELTNDVTPDVLDGMKKLVYSIMRGMGAATVEPGVVLQQSGQAMAQLCMWQLVIGYNLRELEVRDQLQQQLLGPAADTANA